SLDSVGNWKNFSESNTQYGPTIGSLNQYSEFKNETLDHLPDGSLVKDVAIKLNSSSSAQHQYRYDAFGRLREVIRPNGGSGSVVAYYHYDARGRRVYRAADVNRNGNANEHCRYIYDGDRL